MGAEKKGDALLVAAMIEECGGFCASWFWGVLSMSSWN